MEETSFSIKNSGLRERNHWSRVPEAPPNIKHQQYLLEKLLDLVVLVYVELKWSKLKWSPFQRTI